MNNYNVPESAINALEEHTSSDDGLSDSQISDMADFIELRLFAEKGELSREAVFALFAFEERMKDAINEQRGSDEAFSSWIGRLSRYDPDGAAEKLAELSREVILWVAEQHFDELADEARSLGWIE